MSKHTPLSSKRVIQIRPVQTEQDPPADHLSDWQELDEKRQEAERALEDVRVQKAELLREAEIEIQEQKRNWEAEKELLKEEAYQKGLQQGFQQGQQEGYQTYTEKLAQANQIIAQAHDAHQDIVNSSEETMAAIALHCAEKIIGERLEQSPESFLSLVKSAIMDVQGQPEVIVYVHPDQYGTVHMQADELKRVVDFNTQLSFYAKDDLEPYSCLIESPFGRVDAGIDSQLGELRQKVFDFVNGEKSHE